MHNGVLNLLGPFPKVLNTFAGFVVAGMQLSAACTTYGLVPEMSGFVKSRH
jgi:hypothetical protein